MLEEQAREGLAKQSANCKSSKPNLVHLKMFFRRHRSQQQQPIRLEKPQQNHSRSHLHATTRLRTISLPPSAGASVGSNDMERVKSDNHPNGEAIYVALRRPANSSRDARDEIDSVQAATSNCAVEIVLQAVYQAGTDA